MTNPHLAPLALQEISSFSGFTHLAIVTADHLTQATANTVQTIQLGPLPIGIYVYKAEFRPVKAFRNSADAAFNSTTASLGDSAAVTTFITAKQLNANGTPIVLPQLMNTPTGPYAAADYVAITFASMAAKSLVNINEGELHILIQLFHPKTLSDVKRLSSITTK